MNGITAREAAHRIGISRVRVFQLIKKGRIRVIEKGPITRRAGRFARGGFLLEPEDVEREAQARGR